MPHHPILVTGAAGFLGFALARRLLEHGGSVVGIDSINDYYDPALKEARLAVLRQFANFNFHKIDLVDRGAVETIFRDGDFGPVVHLAAQAGVRYSLNNPHADLDAPICGPSIPCWRLPPPQHRALRCLIEFGLWLANTRLPFSVHDNVDDPISL